MRNNLRVVVLCGGSGTRLWPESRQSLPKQFISIIDGKSLFDLTIERVLSISIEKKPIFICNKKHGFLVKEALKKYNLKADIFLEPEAKNTCAAIYFAAKYCMKNDILLIMPSDHLIKDNLAFSDRIEIIKQNLSPNEWITLGVKPTKPSEAYGYVKVDKGKKYDKKRVLKFIEKPSKKIAAEFIRSNEYYWNAGIFIAKANTVIKSIQKHALDIAFECDKIFREIRINNKTNEVQFPQNLYSNITSLSIDYAVMEKENNIFLYPFDNEWNDIGSWDSISEISSQRTNDKKIIQVDSKNNFIRSKKRVIATIGVKDLIIIDSDNATLVSKKNHSEKVKLIVAQLLEKNINEGKEHSFEYRPWGKFENLLENKNCKVKRIIITPKKRLSLQYHNFRSEHWLVVFGKANIYLDGKHIKLLPGQSIDIPIKSQHYIENKENEELVIIETQLGTYFGEDDIIRIDDPYDR